MSTIGSILLTPDPYNTLIIVKADLGSVLEAHGMGIILLLHFKEKPNNIAMFSLLACTW